MPTRRKSVIYDEVLESLMLSRVTCVLNTITKEGENHEVTGFLRGYSDKWIILQEFGKEAKGLEELTIVFTDSIQRLKKAQPREG
jgi:hypothetical protein